MTNTIVTLNISLTQPPAPSTLQRTGAALSQGATVLGVGAAALITQMSDLTPILAASLALSTLSWSNAYGGQVTATTTAAHGIAVGEIFPTTIAGALPAGYNGTYFAMATGASTFTYYLTANPGSETTPGTFTPKNVGELVAMMTSFFGQGTQQSVYVLELGAGEPPAGVSALQTFIAAQPTQPYYAYLVPRSWDATTSFLGLVAQYEATNSQTYFFTTTTLQNFTAYTKAMKCVVPMCEAPSVGKWVSQTISAATYSTGLVTATTGAAHGVAPGQYFTVTGVSPATYNGTYMAVNGTTGTSLVYAVHADPGSYVSGGSLIASAYASPGIPATEFSIATYFQYVLGQNPTGTVKVPPFAYTYLFGVTPFPVLGNSSILTTLASADISYVATGNFAGVSQNILWKGHSKDGNPFNFWYEVDWLAINLTLNLTNAVVAGNNTKLNPLYYNQDGINRLEQVAFGTGGTGIQYGLFLGSPKQYQYDQATFTAKLNDGDFAGQMVFNAVPFTSYATINPNDYPIGKYGGFSCVAIPQNGFEDIIFNLNVTQFVG